MAKPGPETRCTPELAEWICEIIATHDEGLRRLHERYADQGFPPHRTLQNWRRDYDFFRDLYRETVREKADRLAYDGLRDLDDLELEGIHPAAANAYVQRAKARAEYRIRMAGLLDRAQWSATHKHELSGPEGGPMRHQATVIEHEVTDADQLQKVTDALLESGVVRAGEPETEEPPDEG